jgi:DNA polymerase-3 subunit gamma/tau
MEQAKALTTAEILRTLDVLAETDRELRFTSQPRLLVELALARICGRGESPDRKAAQREEGRGRTPAPPAPTREPEEDEAPEPATVAGDSGQVDLAEIQRRWDDVIAYLRKSKKTAEAAFLREAVPAALEDGTLLLEFSHLFHHDQMTEKRRQLTAKAVADVFGVNVVIKCRMASGDGRGSREEQPSERKEQRSKLDDVLSIFPGSELEK